MWVAPPGDGPQCVDARRPERDDSPAYQRDARITVDAQARRSTVQAGVHRGAAVEAAAAHDLRCCTARLPARGSSDTAYAEESADTQGLSASPRTASPARRWSPRTAAEYTSVSRRTLTCFGRCAEAVARWGSSRGLRSRRSRPRVPMPECSCAAGIAPATWCRHWPPARTRPRSLFRRRCGRCSCRRSRTSRSRSVIAACWSSTGGARASTPGSNGYSGLACPRARARHLRPGRHRDPARPARGSTGAAPVVADSLLLRDLPDAAVKAFFRVAGPAGETSTPRPCCGPTMRSARCARC